MSRKIIEIIQQYEVYPQPTSRPSWNSSKAPATVRRPSAASARSTSSLVAMIKLPYRIIVPMIIAIRTIGTYSVHASIVETWIMIVAGIAGFLMKRFGFSPATIILALVLGPIAEEALRQTLTISSGSYMIFLQRSMSLWIIAVFAVIIAGPVFVSRLSPGKAEAKA